MEPRRARPGWAGSAPRNGACARRWLTAFTGIFLAAVATTWAAGPAEARAAQPAVPHAAAAAAALQPTAGLGTQATPDEDTITVDPPAVPAQSTHDFTFAYESAKPVTGLLILTLLVPAGWTPPAPPAQTAGPGSVSVACPACRDPKTGLTPVIEPGVDGQQIIVKANIKELDEPALTITYHQAKAPATAGSVTFEATERPPQTKPPTVPRVSSPQVDVTCADGTGTVEVSPHRATAESTSTLIFTYTAGGCAVTDGIVALTVPAGWTLPSTVPGMAGYVTASIGSVSVSGAMMMVSGVTLAAGQQFTITYNHADTPAVKAQSGFAASEQSAEAGSLTALLPYPQVMVTPRATSTSTASTPAGSSSSTATESTPSTPSRSSGTPTPSVSSSSPDTTGTMTVSPGSVRAGHPSPLTFTYRAPTSGLPATGEVMLTVPPGWSLPSTTPDRPGYASATTGAARVSGRQIVVTGAALAAGQPLTISYHPAVAPRAAGNSVFGASERASTAAVLTALTDPPSVAITGPSPLHIPATVWFILATAACAAGLAVARVLKRRGQRPPEPPAPTLNTEPHPGPPGRITVQPSPTEPTHCMRIEPHPAAAVTTIEESTP